MSHVSSLLLQYCTEAMQTNSDKIPGFSKGDQEPKDCSVMLLKTVTVIDSQFCGLQRMQLSWIYIFVEYNSTRQNSDAYSYLHFHTLQL